MQKYGSVQHIESQAAQFQDVRLRSGLTPQQRAHASQQLLETEGLGQIVIGAEVEALDAVLHSVAGAEDQDRLVKSPLTPGSQQVEAVSIRQLDIQHDGVVARFAQRIQSLLTRRNARHHVRTLRQALFQEARQTHLIFDNEDLHSPAP